METLYSQWKAIKPYFENRTIIAFNANHQVSSLIASFMYYRNNIKEFPDFKDETLPDFDFLCLHLMTFETYTYPSNRLDELCKSQGQSTCSHNCLSMAEGCYSLTEKIMQDTNCHNLLQLKQKLNVTLGERFSYSKYFEEERINFDYLPCLPKAENNPYFEKVYWH